MVIHSLRWIKLRFSNGRKVQGEGDFVLFNRFKGILVIEVIKGGEVEYYNREWFSTDYLGVRHKIQDPEKQANDTKYELIERFKNKKIKGIPIFHSVWFPDVRVSPTFNLPINYNREIIFDEDSLRDPSTPLDYLTN